MLRVLLLFIGMSVSGCFMSASITNINETVTSPIISLFKSSSVDSVGGSTGYVTTSISGYKVIQTAGVIVNRGSVVTPNGYRVYLNVSGRINADDVQR